ncbi:hypothetical protein H5410_009907 [Solanum commersonii]|uniref:Uncharacterized protein n=1 Tax=Solanum commersonii TaxID=4109 RepID=A0A9J6AJS2_SOLCO|nr:hypothetical protein H5410_009907 [Solanum commersonii]
MGTWDMKRGYFDATDVWYLMTTMEIPGLSAEASISTTASHNNYSRHWHLVQNLLFEIYIITERTRKNALKEKHEETEQVQKRHMGRRITYGPYLGLYIRTGHCPDSGLTENQPTEQHAEPYIIDVGCSCVLLRKCKRRLSNPLLRRKERIFGMTFELLKEPSSGAYEAFRNA